MHFLFIVIILTVATSFSEAITTRGSGQHWRTPLSEFTHHYNERDQYREHSHLSYYGRRPSPVGVEDIFKENERQKNHHNPRFNRQNNWFLDEDFRNTEAYFPRDPFKREYQTNQIKQNTGNFQNINNLADIRQTYAPAPHLPWEDALRHSVYLTLIRDKINNILINKRRPSLQSFNQNPNGKDVYESTDVDLWRHIKKAPFKSNGKERGPVFGDIAILSRGKLVEKPGGFEFVEDENFKECIECHLFSARPNEDEAEKILMKKCDHPNCKNTIIRALWTVRRIRHRNTDGSEPKFMYELMFSIASPKTDEDKLDYNLPSQTFTINENEEYSTDIVNKKSNKIAFNVEKAQEYYPTQLDTDNGNSQNTKVSESLNLADLRNKPDPRIMNEYEEDIQEHKTPMSVITHLHHHYYLNDKGVPMSKPSIMYDKYNDKDVLLTNTHPSEQNIEMDPRSVLSHNKKTIFSSTAKNGEIDDISTFPVTSPDTKFYTTDVPTTKPINVKQINLLASSLSHTKGNKKNNRKPKQFIPSPKDERIIYSEPDPLYVSTTIPKHSVQLSTVVNSNSHDSANSNVKYSNHDEEFENYHGIPSDSPVLSYEETLIIPEKGTTIENIYVSENSTSIHENEEHKDNTSIEPIEFVYPETTKHIDISTEAPKFKNKIERKPYKITRRIKQKTFSELLKTPTTKPITHKKDKTTNSNLTLESISTKPDIELSKTNDTTIEDRRTTGRKYQRKYNSWNYRRGRFNSSTTTTEKSTTADELDKKTDIDVTDHENTETYPTTNYVIHEDNVEGESEKDESIDRISDGSNYETTTSMEELINASYNDTSSYETTTESPATDETDYFTEKSQTTSFSRTVDEHQNSTEVTTLKTEQDYEDFMYTPLTKKSYVTSISLKLGNKTRPFLSSKNFHADSDENFKTTENKTSAIVTLPPNNIFQTNNINKSTPTPSPLRENIEESSEEEVEVAKIVEHSSLHKLKLELEQKK